MIITIRKPETNRENKNYRRPGILIVTSYELFRLFSFKEQFIPLIKGGQLNLISSNSFLQHVSNSLFHAAVYLNCFFSFFFIGNGS